MIDYIALISPPSPSDMYGGYMHMRARGPNSFLLRPNVSSRGAFTQVRNLTSGRPASPVLPRPSTGSVHVVCKCTREGRQVYIQTLFRRNENRNNRKRRWQMHVKYEILEAWPRSRPKQGTDSSRDVSRPERASICDALQWWIFPYSKQTDFMYPPGGWVVGQ